MTKQPQIRICFHNHPGPEPGRTNTKEEIL